MKVALTIAGSDSGGGAGVQADIKTFESHGVFAASAVTALTAQNTTGVYGIYAATPEFVAAQIRAVLSDFDVAAIKVGMLFSKEIIESVKRELRDFSGFIVIDPVCVSKAGSSLLEEDAASSLLELCEIADLVTPNMREAQKFYGYSVGDSDSLGALKALSYPVLIKNHIVDKKDGALSVDILYDKNQKAIFETPLADAKYTHGAGCSFSSAVCANLALGYSLADSIARAKWFVYHAICAASNSALGKGKHPLAHQDGYRRFIEYMEEKNENKFSS